MDLESFFKKREEMQKLLAEHGESLLQELFVPLFESGLIREVAWTQYTPFFNDGDACVFSVHEPYYLTEKAAKEGYDDYFYEVDSYSLRKETFYNGEDNPNYDPPVAEAVVAFEQKFRKVEDIMQDIFGDHSKITARLKDGEVEFEIEEYDHD